ncbi:hypothetical protein D3C72_2302040 [compost metagenome]
MTGVVNGEVAADSSTGTWRIALRRCSRRLSASSAGSVLSRNAAGKCRSMCGMMCAEFFMAPTSASVAPKSGKTIAICTNTPTAQ